MSNKEKFHACLNQMLTIINGNESNQEMDGTENLCLVMENGLVNEDAKSRLVHLIFEMKKDVDDLQSIDQQPSNTGYFSGFSNPFGSKKVQVLIPIKTSITTDFAASLTKLCKDISFKCEVSNNIGTMRQDLPLVVVCPISSRLEPDIDHALNGLNWKVPFASLVLHSSTESSLPRLPTGTRLSEMEKYQITEFIDIAFTKEAKLYNCQMNLIAKEKLKSFFDRFYKK